MARRLPKYQKPHIPPFRQIAQAVSETANAVLDEEAEAFANEERDLFVRKIERQTFRSFTLEPLKSPYAARKKRAGADPRVMIATKWYIQHIRVWRNRDPAGNRRVRYYRVGFHPQVRARDLKGRIVPITLNRLAWAHEEGRDEINLPARPHWRPHLNTMVRKAPAVRRRIRGRITKEVGLRLRGVF
jgi:hypothetical protein